jgi:hypothetical protein
MCERCGLHRACAQLHPSNMMGMLRSPIRSEKLTGESFMSSGLMLDNMRQSADIGVHTHGGPA